MKILHIIPSYLPATFASGPIIPTHNLNKELVKKGVKIVVYTTNLDGKNILNIPIGQEINVDGVKVFYFPITFRPWQYSYKFHQALAKNIEEFDLIHITSVFLSASTLGAYYAKKYRKPYIISPHGSLMKEPLKYKTLKKKIYLYLIEKRNLAEATVHFIVDIEKEDYFKTGLSLKKAIIISNSIDIENLQKYNNIQKHDNIRINFRKKFNIDSDKKIILFLGRLYWIKGFDTLIPAFEKVIKEKSSAVLVLAGPDEGNYKKEIELMIGNRKLIIGKNVIFTGMLTGNDKIAAYQESDVFVLPSYTEALSMAIIEAMSFGIPIITTKNVGSADSILKANAGIVIEKNEQQLTEAILKILNEPNLAKKMGENGKRLVVEKFSADKIANKWIEEYNKIIKNV